VLIVIQHTGRHLPSTHHTTCYSNSIWDSQLTVSCFTRHKHESQKKVTDAELKATNDGFLKSRETAQYATLWSTKRRIITASISMQSCQRDSKFS